MRVHFRSVERLTALLSHCLRHQSASTSRSGTMKPELIKTNKMYGGYNKRYSHDSEVLGCKMVFTVYYPPQAAQAQVPVLYYLSGLTCNDENFIQKAGAQRSAAKHGIALVAPDTSPRGLGVPGEADSWDFGVGAGFYVDATQPKWAQWRMYSYVTKELPQVLRSLPELNVDKASMMGHSMGGHGALVIGLRNPGDYASISAFAPICNPINVPWGHKAFSGYLGDDREAWKQYDATQLLGSYAGPCRSILVDTGTADDFLAVQLKPEALEAAAAAAGDKVKLVSRMQDGYDHSYFFIATFMDDHIEHHAKALC